MAQHRDIHDLGVEAPDWFVNAFDVPRAEGTVDVDGCPIHFFEWGDRTAPGVLLTHGFLAHARVFAFIAPLLADRFHLVAYDLSGMGDSGHRAVYGDRVAEAMAVAEYTGLFDHSTPPIFVTHSFGGTVAISAVEQYPDRFSGIVLTDLMMMSAAGLEAWLKRDDIARLPPERAKGHRVYPDLPAAMARFRLAPSQSCDNDYLMAFMGRHSLKAVDGGWTWKFDPKILLGRRGAEFWAQLPHRFTQLPLRKAIVHGRDSLLFTSDSTIFVRSLTDERFPIIGLPGAQHHLMLDQPLAYISALDALLSAWSSDGRGST